MADLQQFKCLLAGIDTLELSISVKEYKLTEEQWNLISNAKQAAQNTRFDKGCVIEILGHKFEVKRTGGQRYNYILENGDVTIKISQEAQGGKYFPELHITFRSEYI
jgi:hypothetical protein